MKKPNFQLGKSFKRFIRTLLQVIPVLVMIAASAVPAAKAKPSDPPVDNSTITDTWAIQVELGTDVDALAEQLGAENLGQVGSLTGYYLFRIPGTDNEATAMADIFASSTDVLWFEQQVARQQSKRVLPTDPLFANQWHLQNTGQFSGTSGEDINIVPAWNAGYTGSGVLIGVVDDGLQYTHPDISPNYNASASYDFNGGDTNPAPTSNDKHGTSAAGVAAARDDGSSCGVGAAYRAGLAGLRLISAPTTDAQEASALTYHYNSTENLISIYSNSWGPPDANPYANLDSPGPLTLAALKDGVENGRGGKGSLYIWAAGNGLAGYDNINYDGYANSRYTIAVGAIDHNGEQAPYSEPGAAMFVTAPSSNSTTGITTTDLLGTGGYASGDCTNGFGGTSSSAPLVAGVVALMLEANPNLGWRDVQHILAETADVNDPTDLDWAINGSGHEINHKYGFGRVDAEAAVNLAATWENVGPEVSVKSGTINVNKIIPDGNPNGITSNFVVNDSIHVEQVEVVFNASHGYRGDLKVILTSPSGTKSVLSEFRYDGHANYNAWKFTTVRNWGELSTGKWSLKVIDVTSPDQGMFTSWKLNLYGTSPETTQTTLLSKATKDGWVLESSEASGKGGTRNSRGKNFKVGDDAYNRQFRGILSFDTSGIPDDAIVTSVKLRVKRAGVVGTNPMKTHNGLYVDIRRNKFGTSLKLQISDFQAAASKNKVGKFSRSASSGWYTAVLGSGAYPYIKKDGATQFRLRFAKDDNNDFGADYLKLYSGNAGANSRPQLIVEYIIP